MRPVPRAAATTSDAFNAVAEPRRREILNFLSREERPVGDIVDGLKLEQSNYFADSAEPAKSAAAPHDCCSGHS